MEQYELIKDFPADRSKYASQELGALATVWREQKHAMEQTGEFQEFKKKLQREWAVETGIIERLYQWDRGVTEILIEQGIDSSLIAHRGGVSSKEAEHISALIRDQADVVEGLFEFVKGQVPLTEHYIRSLQAQFTKQQDFIDAQTPAGAIIKVPLLKGEYKKQPNNPRRSDGSIFPYCPPELVMDEMQRLVQYYWALEQSVAPEALAAWLHHRFTQIHPFQDGNGRVARALASLVFLKAGLFPLVIRDGDRKEYIEALEQADNGDLDPLVHLFAVRQRDSVLKALGLEQQVAQARFGEQIISAAIKVLGERAKAKEGDFGQVLNSADRLQERLLKRMKKLEKILNEGLPSVTPPDSNPFLAKVNSAGRLDIKKNHYFHGQITELAKRFGYFSNLETYKSWARLSIHTKEHFEFVVSIHGYGRRNIGIMAVSAFTAKRVDREEGGTEPVELKPACPDLFQFNYAEKMESIEQRFDDWLESVVAIALAEWNRTLS